MTLSRTTDHGPPLTVGSLFTGVGGFDLGLEYAGYDVAWQVEADKWCRQVLRARWPDVDLYGDVKDVGGSTDSKPAVLGLWDEVERERGFVQRRQLRYGGEGGIRSGRTTLPPVDLICGGFPCQDVSVAGRREGLDAERSGLFFEFVRIADSVAPRWLLVENVPGLLSSNDGEDFAVVLAELTGFHPDVPEGGWSDGGFCEGPKRRCFWRVLDTQHFGPPQRRRRVFLVCDSRARCGPEILLEPESVPGHPAAGREAGEGAAGESPGGFATTGRGYWRRGRGTLSARDWRDQSHLVVDGPQAFGGNRTSGPRYKATALNAACPPRYDFETETFVVGDGHVTAFNAYQRTVQGETAYPIQASDGRKLEKGVLDTAACFADLRRHAEGHRGMIRKKPCINATNNDPVYPTLRENWRNNSNPATEARMLVTPTGDKAHTLRGRGCDASEDGTGRGPPTISTAIPRRLTPRECERLQGFPDDWTATGIDADGEPTEISDTQRYRQMGNAVSVPVAAWIGSRIVAAEMGAVEAA